MSERVGQHTLADEQARKFRRVHDFARLRGYLTAATQGTNANRFVGSTSMKWDEYRRLSCWQTGGPVAWPSGLMDSTQLRAQGSFQYWQTIARYIFQSAHQ